MSDVTVAFNHWKGQWRTTAEESAVIAVHHFEIDGVYLWPEFVTLHNDGPFLLASVAIPTDYATEMIQARKDEVAEVRAVQEPGTWEESTTDDVLVLYVSRIEWVEMPVEVLA